MNPRGYATDAWRYHLLQLYRHGSRFYKGTSSLGHESSLPNGLREANLWQANGKGHEDRLGNKLGGHGVLNLQMEEVRISCHV